MFLFRFYFCSLFFCWSYINSSSQFCQYFLLIYFTFYYFQNIMTSRSKDQKPDAVSLTKRRPQAFAKFNPRLFLTHRRAILLPPELHRIFFPKEENERLRCLCLSQSPAEHFSHILSSLLNFLFAEFFGQCLDLFYVLFLHSGHYFYIILWATAHFG